jgi:hypothetical protein
MFVVRKSEKAGLEKRSSRSIPGIVLIALIMIGTSGCSSISAALGSSKHSPDEFAVVTKAPLVMPPDFSLRPPRPGARRPQDTISSRDAANTVFGPGATGGSSGPSDGERMLIAGAGATDADNSIRDLVDSEYFTIQRTNQNFANKILFWKGETVDPATGEAPAED